MAKVLTAAFFIRRDNAGFAKSLVQQRIELSLNFIFLGAGDMAIRAFVQRFHLGSWRFRLMMIEIVETPPSYIDGPLFQNRKTQKVVTRGAQQVAINSAIS